MLFLSVRGFFDYAGPINPLAINVVVVLPSSLPERSRHPDPSVFRSSIARPTDTSVYASSATSRCHLQDSRPGWSRCLLSCRALSSPTTCRFTPAHSDIPTYRDLEKYVNTAAFSGSNGNCPAPRRARKRLMDWLARFAVGLPRFLPLSPRMRSRRRCRTSPFCIIARRCASELEYELVLAGDLKLLQTDDYEQLAQQCSCLIKRRKRTYRRSGADLDSHNAIR
jgi:hypothetical protein